MSTRLIGIVGVLSELASVRSEAFCGLGEPAYSLYGIVGVFCEHASDRDCRRALRARVCSGARRSAGSESPPTVYTGLSACSVSTRLIGIVGVLSELASVRERGGLRARRAHLQTPTGSCWQPNDHEFATR